MLKTSFPTGAELPRAHAPRACRKRGKTGRSYTLLGSPEFFKTPVTWGYGLIAKAIRAQGGERVTMKGEPTRVEYPAPVSPERGARVELPNLGPIVTIGAGQSLDEQTVGRSPCVDVPTSYSLDGDTTVRDARRRKIVKAMIKAR